MAKSDNLLSWSNRLKHFNPLLAQELIENKHKGQKTLEILNLPHYKQITASLVSFLNDPQSYFKKIKSDLYFIILKPLSPALNRFYQLGMTKSEIIPFIKKTVSKEMLSQYQILFSEFYLNIYGGHIIVSEYSNLLLELVEGEEIGLAYGKKTPKYIVSRNPFTGFFKYSFIDRKMRKILYQTIYCLPHKGSSPQTEFHPGYYEFILYCDPHQQLKPIFIDYSDNPLYSIGLLSFVA